MDELKVSLDQYNNQLGMVNDAIAATKDDKEREPLIELQSELKQLIQLTQESLDAIIARDGSSIEKNRSQDTPKTEIDDEYALFMQEMAETGAYESNEQNKLDDTKNSGESDIEDELASLLGMKCAVYHTHKWGGQPTLHNAMVSEVVPHQEDDQFKDLQVRVLFTHPTHAEMLPCPFYLDGECRFEDEKCRYSHGDIIPLSSLKDAIEPNFETVKIGSRILLKLKPPEGEDITLTKKNSEKYHLWHRAVVKSINLDEKSCLAKLEHGMKTGEKRKCGTEEINIPFEEIFPLNAESDNSSDSEDSISDTEYPDNKAIRPNVEKDGRELLVEKSLESSAPAMGEWERHTRGIGSKLMFAMGYVPGTGLGATGDGRVQPVEARLLPTGRSLDTCMAISERNAAQDPLKVEQRLKRLQKREEERNKRAYEREKEKERKNVFNFLNRTIGDSIEDQESSSGLVNLKQSSSKDLNVEKFKITEDTRKIEKEVLKLNSSLSRYPSGSDGHRSIKVQITEKNKELAALRNAERQICIEQTNRKDKQKLTIF